MPNKYLLIANCMHLIGTLHGMNQNIVSPKEDALAIEVYNQAIKGKITGDPYKLGLSRGAKKYSTLLDQTSKVIHFVSNN